MSNDADRFRRRAADCRDLSQSARDVRDRSLLKDMAEELDAEADKIDAEESTTDEPKCAPQAVA